MEIESIHTGRCHCGAVVFEVTMPDGLVDPRRCDCSLCRRRGAIMATATPQQFRILHGEEQLTLYQFNTLVARHYFCGRCGIYTHHWRRSRPNELGFNVACLDGVDPLELEPVPVNDGVNHPSDR